MKIFFIIKQIILFYYEYIYEKVLTMHTTYITM